MLHIAPPVRIRESDFHRLRILAGHTAEGLLESASLLHEELLRAEVVPDEATGSVQIGTRVRYRDHFSGSVHDVKLCYPKDALFKPGTISALSPIGAALIGLSPGASLVWNANDGSKRGVTVLAANAAGGIPPKLRAEVPS